ncbi:MAG: NAD-binding protein [Oligoflexia bacterium]|nr:NAD-binding protein [Oligoflexia bacterium]
MSDSIQSISGHIVILGWSRRVERIVRELRNDVHRLAGEMRPILIITEQSLSQTKTDFERVYFLHGRYNDMEVLRRANLDTAHSLLIPTTIPEADAADGQSVFSLLAALSVNPSLRVCVEVARAESSDTLSYIRRKGVTEGDVEIVSFESFAERILAQTAVNRGVSRVYDHLLSFGTDSNEVYMLPLPANWHGKTFRALFQHCFEREVIVIGFERAGQLCLNPKNRDTLLAPDDAIWFIAYDKAAGIACIGK